MSEIGDALKAHYGSRITRTVVPEWKGIVPDDSHGEPAVYSKPFTLGDSKALQSWIDRNDPEGWGEVVRRKACREDGERMFDMGDRKVLLEHAELNVMQRLAQSIMDGPTLEEAAGNSSATQD